MLNIRINLTVNVRKLTAVLGAMCFVWSQLLTPAHALPVLAPQERAVTVALQYLNVSTTKSAAQKALASPYVKYFDPETIAFLTEYANGQSMKEWKCLDQLWSAESHFNPKALNMSSKAFGLAQFLPTTWTNYKIKKTSVAVVQVQYGLHYIKVRYGTACNAWAFHRKNGWY